MVGYNGPPIFQFGHNSGVALGSTVHAWNSSIYSAHVWILRPILVNVPSLFYTSIFPISRSINSYILNFRNVRFIVILKLILRIFVHGYTRRRPVYPAPETRHPQISHPPGKRFSGYEFRQIFFERKLLPLFVGETNCNQKVIFPLKGQRAMWIRPQVANQGTDSTWGELSRAVQNFFEKNIFLALRAEKKYSNFSVKLFPI